MPSRQLNPDNLGPDEDWEGSNAAFKCPHCGKVYIVSGSQIHRGERQCPQCGKSTARISAKGGPQVWRHRQYRMVESLESFAVLADAGSHSF